MTATEDKPLTFRSLNPLSGQLNFGAGEIRCALHEQMWDAKVCELGKPRTGNFFAGLYNQESHTAAVLGALTAVAESKVRVQSTNRLVKFDLLAAYDGPGAGELRVGFRVDHGFAPPPIGV